MKNPCRIAFPEYLDITPFTTSGELSTSPIQPISQPTTPIVTPIEGRRFVFPTSGLTMNGVHPGPNSQQFPSKSPISPPVSHTLYRLAAVVCHYGAHSYGHYVTFRRVPGDRWLRASDSDVVEVSLRDVLSETMGTFMLYYERLDDGNSEKEGENGSAEHGQAEKGLGSTHTTSVVLPAGSDVEKMLRVPRTSFRPRVLRSVSIMSSTTRASSLAPSVIHESDELPARPRTPSRTQPMRLQRSPPTSPPRLRQVHSPRPMSHSPLPPVYSQS